MDISQKLYFNFKYLFFHVEYSTILSSFLVWFQTKTSLSWFTFLGYNLIQYFSFRNSVHIIIYYIEHILYLQCRLIPLFAGPADNMGEMSKPTSSPIHQHLEPADKNSVQIHAYINCFQKTTNKLLEFSGKKLLMMRHKWKHNGLVLTKVGIDWLSCRMVIFIQCPNCPIIDLQQKNFLLTVPLLKFY